MPTSDSGLWADDVDETKLPAFLVEARRRVRERRQRAAELGVNCPDCLDTGKMTNPPEDSDGICGCTAAYPFRLERWERILNERESAARLNIDREIKVPARFHGFTFETYPEPNIAERVREWLADHDGHRGLYLTGSFGRGKTALVLSALKELVIVRARKNDFRDHLEYLGIFTTVTGLLESLRPQHDADRAFASDAYSLNRYREIPYLAIDDLGSERLTAWGADRLFEVINHRHNELLPMLITSNLTLNQLADRMNKQVGDGESGDRIVNRLMESCDVISLGNGKNLRMGRAA